MRFPLPPLRQFSLTRDLQWCAVLLVALLLSAFSQEMSAQKPVAVLPQTYIDTTWNPPTGGTTWPVHSSSTLQTTLNLANPGDTIVLDAGVTYTGNFSLIPKSNPNHKWIYIVSSALNSLPPPGTQVSTTDAVNMPKIVTPNVAPALTVIAGSSYYRLVGLEITTTSTQGCSPNHNPPLNCFTYIIVDTPYTQYSLSDSITVDRCYLHGVSNVDVQRAIVANASNFAVIDSFIDTIQMIGADTQAVIAYHTPGPLKIVNNYLSSAGENILLGGAGANSNPWVPSDVEIRNNYLFKPLTWVPLSLNGSLVVKNAFEVKSGQRILFDHNQIENVWAGGQTGFAIVLTVRSSQSGDVSVVNDITVTNNTLKNVVAGFNTLAADDQCGNSSYPNCHNAGSQDRWYIANNQITFYDPKQPGGFKNSMLALMPGWNNFTNTQGQIRDLVFQHNTGVAVASTPCWDSVYFSAGGQSPPLNNLTNNIWLLDNVFCRQPFGDWGLQGTAGLTQYMGYPGAPPYDLTQRFYGNVLYAPPGEKLQSFPPHNYATTVPFTYVDPANGNYQLLSPYWTDTSDGQLAGVHIVTPVFAISGTISGPSGAGATVNLTGAASATTTADATGSYSFAALPNGIYIVTPSNAGSSFTPTSQTVTVNGASVTAVNFNFFIDSSHYWAPSAAQVVRVRQSV